MITNSEYSDAVKLLLDNCTTPDMASFELMSTINGDFETANFLAYVRELNGQLPELNDNELAELERKL